MKFSRTALAESSAASTACFESARLVAVSRACLSAVALAIALASSALFSAARVSRCQVREAKSALAMASIVALASLSASFAA